MKKISILIIFIFSFSFINVYAEDLPVIFGDEINNNSQKYTQINGQSNSKNYNLLIGIQDENQKSEQIVNTNIVNTNKIFKDLSSNHPYINEINKLVEDGVFEGYQDGTFKPDKALNRVEALKLIFEIANIDFTPGITPAKFNDIEENTWYSKYLNQAYYLEIINGYPDGSFKPAAEVNLVEFLKMLLIAQKVDLGKVNMMQIAYQDVEPNTWYTKYINFAKQNNLIDPDFSNRVYPDQPLTRGRAAFVLFSFKNWQKQNILSSSSNKTNDEHNINLNEGQALFVSKNYNFAIQYPKLWFYSNVSNSDAGVIRSYTFGPDDLSSNPPLVSLNLLPLGSNFSTNSNSSKIAYVKKEISDNLISLEANIGKSSRIYQIVGPKAQENIMLQMLESITTNIDGLESYNPAEKNNTEKQTEQNTEEQAEQVEP